MTRIQLVIVYAPLQGLSNNSLNSESLNMTVRWGLKSNLLNLVQPPQFTNWGCFYLSRIRQSAAEPELEPGFPSVFIKHNKTTTNLFYQFIEQPLCWALQIQRWNPSQPDSLITGMFLCLQLCTTLTVLTVARQRCGVRGGVHRGHILRTLVQARWIQRAKRLRVGPRPRWDAACPCLCLIVLGRQSGLWTGPRGQGHPIPTQKSNPLFS